MIYDETCIIQSKEAAHQLFGAVLNEMLIKGYTQNDIERVINLLGCAIEKHTPDHAAKVWHQFQVGTLESWNNLRKTGNIDGVIR